MIPKDLVSLTDFLSAARGQSQEVIISEFLAVVRDSTGLIEDASILIDHPRERKLLVFNDKFLDKSKQWETSFGYGQGIAGRCYRERRTKEYPPRRGGRPVEMERELVGKGAIENMVCVPIMFRSDSTTPFGVVCFHNNDPAKKFGEDDVQTLQAYVDVLALALHTPLPEIQLDKNVFIVHGRDKTAREGLELILRRHKVNPMILRDEKRSGELILDALERVLRICHAGFILVTPDDEGRLREAEEAESDGKFEPRARENVIFEAGLLFAKFRQSERVSILLQKPAKLPSDLSGMFVDQFSSMDEVEKKIADRLRDWGMIT